MASCGDNTTKETCVAAATCVWYPNPEDPSTSYCDNCGNKLTNIERSDCVDSGECGENTVEETRQCACKAGFGADANLCVACTVNTYATAGAGKCESCADGKVAKADHTACETCTDSEKHLITKDGKCVCEDGFEDKGGAHELLDGQKYVFLR